jgi:hypothetical protein
VAVRSGLRRPADCACVAVLVIGHRRSLAGRPRGGQARSKRPGTCLARHRGGVYVRVMGLPPTQWSLPKGPKTAHSPLRRTLAARVRACGRLPRPARPEALSVRNR